MAGATPSAASPSFAYHSRLQIESAAPCVGPLRERARTEMTQFRHSRCEKPGSGHAAPLSRSSRLTRTGLRLTLPATPIRSEGTGRVGGPEGALTRTSRSFTFSGRPVRRLPLAVADRIGRVLEVVGVRPFPLDPPSLHASACSRMAGSARFGSGYEEPLQVLARALSTEAHLTTTGRYFARDTLVGLLERRVEIEAALAERPAILEEPVEAPVVIVGLPRSGTTLLQGLLAADDANRSLRYFEATRPCPPPEEAP